MKKYFKKQPFSKPVNEYLLSIPPSEYLMQDPSFDFRGRCRIYQLSEMAQRLKEYYEKQYQDFGES